MQFPNEPQTEEDIRYPEWQEPFRKALLELDDDKLSARIIAAETAIYNRLRALAGDSDHADERQAMQDALSSLRVLKSNSH